MSGRNRPWHARCRRVLELGGAWLRSAEAPRGGLRPRRGALAALALVLLVSAVVACAVRRRHDMSVAATADGMLHIRATAVPGEECVVLLGEDWTGEQQIQQTLLMRGVAQFSGPVAVRAMRHVSGGAFETDVAFRDVPHKDRAFAVQVIAIDPGPPARDAWRSPAWIVEPAPGGVSACRVERRASKVLRTRGPLLAACALGGALALLLARLLARWRPVVLGLVGSALTVVLAVRAQDTRAQPRPATLGAVEAGYRMPPLWWPLRWDVRDPTLRRTLGRQFWELHDTVVAARVSGEPLEILISRTARYGSGESLMLGVMLSHLVGARVVYEGRDALSGVLYVGIEARPPVDVIVSNKLGFIARPPAPGGGT
jgi:hypothetical protein